MTLLYIKKYTRTYIQLHPDWLFVFGDNFLREGFGGQAKEARDEPNAVGIATKRKPTMEPDAFLTNDDLPRWQAEEHRALTALWDKAKQGRTIIWPLDGIGTGLSRLEKKAPDIWDELEQFRMLIESAGTQ